MKKLIALITALSFCSIANAQARGFGNIDTAGIRLTSSDFEKDANADVLFDRSRLYLSTAGYLNMERHTAGSKYLTKKAKTLARYPSNMIKISLGIQKILTPILKYFLKRCTTS